MPPLKEVIANQVVNAALDVLEGSREDLQRYAQDIAEDAFAVLVEENPEVRKRLHRELLAQVVMIGEMNRIRATEQGWRTARMVLDTALNVGLAALGGSAPTSG